MPTTGPGQYIEGAFELAFGEVSALSVVAASEPAVAIAYASIVSPDAPGGIVASIPAVAIATAIIVSPSVVGGVVSSIPAVAVAYASAICPTVLPPQVSVLGVFGVEPTYEADEWDVEPTYIADEMGAGV